MYNQTLQRFLFFLNEERPKNKFAIHRQQFNQAPLASNVNNIKNIRDSENVLPKIMNFGHAPREKTQENGNKGARKNLRNELVQNEKSDEDSLDYIRDASFLTAHDSDLKDDVDGRIRKRGIKRNKNENPKIDRKKKRNSLNPIYSYIYRPPINRYLIDLKSKLNTTRHNRILKSYLEQKKAPKNPRKRLSKADPLYDPFVIPKKRVKIVLDRNDVVNYLKQREQLGKGIDSLPFINSLKQKLCANSCEKIIKWDSM